MGGQGHGEGGGDRAGVKSRPEHGEPEQHTLTDLARLAGLKHPAPEG
jgi:hypothetical protein